MAEDAAGSSPPVRGALWTAIKTVIAVGLIPARAGSTHPAPKPIHCRRAHPRPCGEHFFAPRASHSWKGSSPPVRGARPARAAPNSAPGLIPARAGSTSRTFRCIRVTRAHPRPCGEHRDAARGLSVEPGSSPPVRGAPLFLVSDTATGGLIPARAGSTSCKPGENAWRRAHPRPCGEHAGFGAAGKGFGGSSPPVRGAPYGVV